MRVRIATTLLVVAHPAASNPTCALEIELLSTVGIFIIPFFGFLCRFGIVSAGNAKNFSFSRGNFKTPPHFASLPAAANP
jgi:hypothetical protein